MKALDLLPHLPVMQWITTKTLAERTHNKPQKVNYLLGQLEADGLVEKKGLTKGTMYRRVKRPSVEFTAFPLPSEVGDYWAISTEFKTLKGHFATYERHSAASIYRMVNLFKALGLVEMEQGKGELTQQGKRAKRFRRKYHSITFRDDGKVTLE